jgi:hypothetical protein
MRRNLLRLAAVTAIASVTAVTATAQAATTAQAAAWESSKLYASDTIGAYTFDNDVWGTGAGPQTIWVNSATKWGVTTDQPNTSGVKSYPHAGRAVNVPLHSLKSVTSSFNETNASGGTWESAYDIWLDHTGTEVMVWTDSQGQRPLGKKVASTTSDGATWDLWAGNNGTNQTYSLVREGNETSGTINLLALLDYIQNTEGSDTNPTLTQVQYGWEFVSTDSTPENFTMNSFSVNYSS